MGFYDRHILPRLIDIACSVRPVGRQREKIVPRARGRVLEVGIGTGLNLLYYDTLKVERVWGLDPALEMHKLAARRVRESGLSVELIGMSGEQIPMDDNTFDTVLVTYTLCSIPDVLKALREMRRVLKPDGELLFCEHGLAPEEKVRRWQHRLTPVWQKIAGGCHLDRPIPELIRQADFKIGDLETLYLPGPRPLTFNYWGSARK
jgi:ubiquinone/menaquinone biosynthesis C-methylase UbiE